MTEDPRREEESPLDALAHVIQEQPTKRDLDRTERRAYRTSHVGVAFSLLIAIVALVMSYFNSSDIAETKVSQKLHASSIAALRQANEKLQAQGLPTLPVPQPGETLDADILSQAAAALVLAQIKGDPTYRGATGTKGAKGEPGKPCLPTTSSCRGPRGTEGRPGEDCDPVIKPACTGPQGQQGVQGEPGTNGTNGTDGNDGTNGRGITKVEFHDLNENPGLRDCVAVFFYTDNTEQQIPIDEVCEDNS